MTTIIKDPFIEQLERQLERAQKNLFELTRVRRFFRGGIEQRVTIGSPQSIAHQKQKVQSLKVRLEEARALEIMPIEQKITTMDTGIDPPQTQQPINLKNIFLIGTAILLIG